MASDPAFGVAAIPQQLNRTLRQYIEAQYHIRNENLIQKRRALLEQPETIYQAPFVEATPVYELGTPYNEMGIPAVTKDVLQHLIPLRLGIYERPYIHQGEALEAFFKDRDIIVATGTGSGKTESFLMPIIGALAMEAHDRPGTASMDGCRALLLYPMNALVNDQLSRIRQIIGDPRSSKLISAGRTRPVRFATYTGRTPYPGKRTASKDGRFIQPLFDEYYLKLLKHDPDVVERLQRRGKWPSKDLEAFYGTDYVEYTTYKSGKRQGKQRTIYHWNDRLRTGDQDRELLTRHEVQARCPDLLVTNYSMLEYMLMRPIERSIFAATRHWLESDKKNRFILVIDEAHLYYGAAGAEVALLIRRLMCRLGISRDRMHCILTSASLGGRATEQDAIDFAAELTGLSDESGATFELITGTIEARKGSSAAGIAECRALSQLDAGVLERSSTNIDAAAAQIETLATELGWGPVAKNADERALRDYVFHCLTGFGPAEMLIELSSGKAISLADLSAALFPSCDSSISLSATAGLLALCTMAKRGSDQRVFLPARLHLFYRGLPGLYVCIDPSCDQKEVPGAGSIVGRLYTDPRLACSCSRRARVYELLTHRDCGAAFVKGYIAGWSGHFLWSERGTNIGDQRVTDVSPIELLVDGDPHPAEEGASRPAWIDVRSGRVAWQEPHDLDGFTKVWAPSGLNERRDVGFAFTACPVCRQAWHVDSTKIMDHETKGEDPFAALVAAQLRLQPPSATITVATPNGGRKVLLFSDGRQKAARLARDIPRAVEFDVFRAALALAVKGLDDLGRGARPNNEFYVSFLQVLSKNNLLLFDGEDRERLLQDVKALNRDYGDDLASAITDLAPDVRPPSQFWKNLLRQLCGRFYSVSDVAIGFVEPNDIGRLYGPHAATLSAIGAEDLYPLVFAWMNSGLETFSLNASLDGYVRRQAAGYNRSPWGSNGKFARQFREALIARLELHETLVTQLEECFAETFAQFKPDDGFYIEPRKARIVIDLQRPWLQCQRCTRLAPTSFRSACLYCGYAELLQLDPDASTYISARKGYWRTPVERALAGERLENVSVEEHTAQLSYRDKSSVYATTERYELRFQDILVDDDRPIDVLSCTTTMEVGIDIGSLLAVGLRNIPPQRSNYQQRAGRTGRRGAAVSSVLTYAQNGPHDGYYFHRPKEIIAGQPQVPQLKIDNPKIARRHINSFLFQTFFNEAIDRGILSTSGDTSVLDKALGRTDEFFHGASRGHINLETFSAWVEERVIDEGGDLRTLIASWLPDSLKIDPYSKIAWIAHAADELLIALRSLKSRVPLPATDELPIVTSERDDPGNDGEETERFLLEAKEQLLEFLFDANLLPSYAFPTNLVGFLIEESHQRGQFVDVRVKEMPQQSIDKALSEYAPGRLVVVNKITYRSGGVAASVTPNVENRAAPLFDDKKTLIYCSSCTFVQEKGTVGALLRCPVCNSTLEEHETIEPQIFLPEKAKPVPEEDRDQDITYATMAQLPVPVGDDDIEFQRLGAHAMCAYSTDRRLITTNKGAFTEGAFSGFLVCTLCGATTLDQEAPASHDRPYLRPHYWNARVPRCEGSFERVYLGSIFKTDLLLCRFNVTTPLVIDASDATERRIIEDALYTMSEALVMAASRHPELDINARELGSGFRIIPSGAAEERIVDIYIFDTSSGGAGYSEMAARYIEDIIGDAIELLEHCKGDCTRSCQECLRHYHNQHFQHRLDRRLGAQFLRYAFRGTVPARVESEKQADELAALARYLELEGRQCKLRASANGTVIPLTVSDGDTTLAVGTYPGLVQETSVPAQPWESEARRSGMQPLRINEYQLALNLPAAHRMITQFLRTPEPVV